MNRECPDSTSQDASASGTNGRHKPLFTDAEAAAFAREAVATGREPTKDERPRLDHHWSNTILLTVEGGTDQARRAAGLERGLAAVAGIDPDRAQSMRAALEATTDAAPPTQAGIKIRIFANFDARTETTSKGATTIKTALRVEQVTERLQILTPGWPKCVGDDLFLQGEDFKPVYLDSSTRLFAWIDRLGQVAWARGGRFIPQERFFEHLRMTCERYEVIETSPHWPKMPGAFYMHPALPKHTKGALDCLRDFYNPATPEDRELIKAVILTLFRGGDRGTRPAILITGPDQDPLQGRGLGKTKLVETLAEGLAGGYIDVSPTDAIADVKTRLLSDGARELRVARLDNVKTLRFSWADLESLITSSQISGRALYKGEGRRPNTLIWCITLNGASLSKDMAQRCIIIKLNRPAFKTTWEEEVRGYIRANRQQLLAEIGSIFESSRDPIKPRTRWAAREQGVLSRTALLEKCQTLIVERQDAVDEDADEKDMFSSYICGELTKKRLDPATACVFFRSALLADWLALATGTKLPTNRASSHILGLGIPELSKSKRDGWPGWRWSGTNAPSSDRASDFEELITF